jgi:preprotein translocase subunit SecA
MTQKFDVEANVEEIRGLEPPLIKKWALDKVLAAYERKEAEYPVMAGLYHFTTRDETTGQKHYDRNALVDWARIRFDVELSVDDLRNKQADEIFATLVAASKKYQARAEQALVEVRNKLDQTGGAHNGQLASLADWMKNNYQIELDAGELNGLDRENLERRLTGAVEDRFRPEIRSMERSLVLQLLDTQWKDHLLAMDHLRSSVGLRSYAQVDPKVEYRREGMRIFERMWDSIGDSVTDLAFRVEQLDPQSIASTWTDSRASHESMSPGPATAMQSDQQQAIQNSENVKIEPIRNRGEVVGRNDPCPCGSGKKYKQCCMRKGAAT